MKVKGLADACRNLRILSSKNSLCEMQFKRYTNILNILGDYSFIQTLFVLSKALS